MLIVFGGANAQVYNPTSKLVETVATANQDPVLGLTVLVGIDLWECVFIFTPAST